MTRRSGSKNSADNATKSNNSNNHNTNTDAARNPPPVLPLFQPPGFAPTTNISLEALRSVIGQQFQNADDQPYGSARGIYARQLSEQEPGSNTNHMPTSLPLIPAPSFEQFMSMVGGGGVEGRQPTNLLGQSSSGGMQFPTPSSLLPFPPMFPALQQQQQQQQQVQAQATPTTSSTPITQLQNFNSSGTKRSADPDFEAQPNKRRRKRALAADFEDNLSDYDFQDDLSYSAEQSSSLDEEEFEKIPERPRTSASQQPTQSINQLQGAKKLKKKRLKVDSSEEEADGSQESPQEENVHASQQGECDNVEGLINLVSRNVEDEEEDENNDQEFEVIDIVEEEEEQFEILELTAKYIELDKEESYIIQKSYEIERAKEVPKVQIQAQIEPKKSRTHWDEVLDEVKTVAQDFIDERKGRMAVSKRISRQASRCSIDAVKKNLQKEKDELQKIRKRAQWISKEVARFWNHAKKIRKYKTSVLVEQEKKLLMDKHLDHLVGQTEKYSSLMAHKMKESKQDGDDSSSDVSEKEGSVREQGDVQSEQGSDNWQEMDSEDDESTLSEEIKLANKENKGSKRAQRARHKQEINELQNDLDVPIEEILARYQLQGRNEENGSQEQIEKVQQSKKEENEKQDHSNVNEQEDDDEENSIKFYEEYDGYQSTRIEELMKTTDEEEKGMPVTKSRKDTSAILAIPESIEEESQLNVKMGQLNVKMGQQETADQQQGEEQPGHSQKWNVPFLLKHELRAYQEVGVQWLVALYHRRLNGILADEMGLGKTIQAIGLLAHLACTQGIWGPHLIVVPTSVMLNWEMEFKKWCPAFKVLTYYGSRAERKAKRQGWTKVNAFHICITSYTLILSDANMFKRKKWRYLILDEAHLIKNWKSQRWQTLLNFNSHRRLLITGTPLQNDLMELWALLHFLMPHVFTSMAQFKDWFVNPMTNMVEGQQKINVEIVRRLHHILRPFILRRLKSEVERQLPQKHEHVLYCKLSKRQRTLYEDYVSSSQTKNKLASGNFIEIANVLMQLRKVCNHPDLFEGRQIVTAFDMPHIQLQIPSCVANICNNQLWNEIDLQVCGLVFNPFECVLSSHEMQRIQDLQVTKQAILNYVNNQEDCRYQECEDDDDDDDVTQNVSKFLETIQRKQQFWRNSRLELLAHLNEQRCNQRILYGCDLIRKLKINHPIYDIARISEQPQNFLFYSNILRDLILTIEERAGKLTDVINTFTFVVPRARTVQQDVWCSRPDLSIVLDAQRRAKSLENEYWKRSKVLWASKQRQQLFFPDRKLIQFDCGKLQLLADLLRRLHREGHRVLIFTQMSKMLDVLESFLNIHGFVYMRLDGSTKPEDRQIMMQRFNTNSKIFAFILSTRSGGVGINLTGADTVIFYDSDWNPAMDKQAQDRCHRIGQTREVNIYRLVSEHTIEENILKKSDQKRHLDHLAIQSGTFNADFLSMLGAGNSGGSNMLSTEELKAALRNVEDADDVEAADRLQEECDAELREFEGEGGQEAEKDETEDNNANKSNTSGNTKNNDDKQQQTPSQSTEVHPNTDQQEEDDASLRDVTNLANEGKVTIALEQLDNMLKPVDKYALKQLDEIEPQVSIKEAAQEVVLSSTAGQQQWDVQELEAIKFQMEIEMEEDEELRLVDEWDVEKAQQVYEDQLLAVRRQWEERERQWLLQYQKWVQEQQEIGKKEEELQRKKQEKEEEARRQKELEAEARMQQEKQEQEEEEKERLQEQESLKQEQAQRMLEQQQQEQQLQKSCSEPQQREESRKEEENESDNQKVEDNEMGEDSQKAVVDGEKANDVEEEWKKQEDQKEDLGFVKEIKPLVPSSNQENGIQLATRQEQQKLCMPFHPFEDLLISSLVLQNLKRQQQKSVQPLGSDFWNQLEKTYRKGYVQEAVRTVQPNSNIPRRLSCECKKRYAEIMSSILGIQYPEFCRLLDIQYDVINQQFYNHLNGRNVQAFSDMYMSAYSAMSSNEQMRSALELIAFQLGASPFLRPQNGAENPDDILIESILQRADVEVSQMILIKLVNFVGRQQAGQFIQKIDGLLGNVVGKKQQGQQGQGQQQQKIDGQKQSNEQQLQPGNVQ